MPIVKVDEKFRNINSFDVYLFSLKAKLRRQTKLTAQMPILLFSELQNLAEIWLVSNYFIIKPINIGKVITVKTRPIQC